MLSNLFFRNTRLTALCLGLIAVAGLTSFHSLARQEDPALSRRMGMVKTVYPGSSAVRVESLVTERIEDELQELYEIKTLESTSRTGMSVIKIELQDRYNDATVDEVWSKVRDRLADAGANMPAGASAPELEEMTTIATTLVVGLGWTHDDMPQLDLLSRLARELEEQLGNLPGTRETDLYGEATEEIHVTVDGDTLASLSLTPADVSFAIARADAKVPAGQLRSAGSDILIEVDGALDSVERIRAIPLRERSDGLVLHVGDIAEVEKTVRDPAERLALLSSGPGVVVSASMEANLRVDQWASRARVLVEHFRAELPRGVELEILFDQSGYTEERLSTLALNLLLGAAIVIAILFFMMGARSALVVGLALPLTVGLVLAELQAIGMPLHQTSVTGLIIALGLLIDNAIVVVDDYRAELAKGYDVPTSVSRAVRHLFVPLFASTLTTVLSFLPIVLMPGGGGEFVGPIAVGVALCVSTSFVIAMTIIPAIAGRFMPDPPSEGPKRWWRDGYSDEALRERYAAGLDLVLKRPWVGVGISLVLPLIGFGVATTLTEQFFPPNDRNQFQLQMQLPSHASLAETEAHALHARALLHAHPEVLESQWFLGEGAPRVFYNMLGSTDRVSSYAGAFVTTRSADATEALLPGLQRELADAFPDSMVLTLPFEQGPPFDAPIEVRVYGPDLQELRRLGEEVRRLMIETDGVTYTRAQLAGGRPKLMVVADEDQARLAGLRLMDIAEQLEAKLEGVTGGSVIEGGEELPVRVRGSRQARGDLSQVAVHKFMPSRTGAGPAGATPEGVPLSALARVELVPELSGIPRRSGERTNTIQAYLVPYTLIAESLSDFERRLEEADLQLPAGYRLELGGESEQRGEAIGNLLVFALPLLVVMAGTIILSFNSFRFAAVIFFVAFLSIGLAMLGVWLFGHPMGFLAVVGTMGLVGLAINGGIVVLSALKASPAAMAGDREATREVVIGATRHILATTLTTVGGFLPLILFGGRFWPPLATAIAGGVGGSAILSLYLVPSLFIVIARSRRGVKALEGTTEAHAQRFGNIARDAA